MRHRDATRRDAARACLAKMGAAGVPLLKLLDELRGGSAVAQAHLGQADGPPQGGVGHRAGR